MKKEKNELIEWVKSIIIAIVLAIVIKSLVFEFIVVKGGSMNPTLIDGERLLINKYEYIIKKPKYKDIIVFRYSNDPSYQFIKRVIAVEDDTIEIDDGKIYVNDVVWDEPYILERTLGDFSKRLVPKNTIFVLGDNRNNSKDSRFEDVGFVELDLIEGKADYVVWPIKSFKKIK